MVMKRFLTLFFAAIAVIAATARDDVQRYKVEVGQFDRLKVTDNVNVVYRCLPDSTGFAQYAGSKEFADAFILTPEKGQLRVQVSVEDVGNPNLPVLYVYSDFLTEVTNDSEFTLRVENPAPAAEFKTTQVGNGTLIVENIKANKVKASLTTGNGTVNLSGETQEAALNMLGTGMISADRLKSRKVTCKILGSGSIGCWPEESLNVRGIGSTKIYYRGNPKVKKSGGGKLFKLPEKEMSETVVVEDEPETVVEEEVSDAAVEE